MWPYTNVLGCVLPTWHYDAHFRWVLHFPELLCLHGSELELNKKGILHEIWKIKVKKEDVTLGRPWWSDMVRNRYKGPQWAPARQSSPSSARATCLSEYWSYAHTMAPNPPLYSWLWDYRWAQLLKCSCKLSLIFLGQHFIWIWLLTVSLTSTSLFQTCT